MRVLVSDSHRELIEGLALSCLSREDNGEKVVEKAAVRDCRGRKRETRTRGRIIDGRIVDVAED
jgi:hypothetical protein